MLEQCNINISSTTVIVKLSSFRELFGFFIITSASCAQDADVVIKTHA